MSLGPNDLFSGGFKYVLLSPLRWEDSHFDSYFSNGLKQPPSFIFKNCFWHVFIPIDNTSQFCWFEDDPFLWGPFQRMGFLESLRNHT